MTGRDGDDAMCESLVCPDDLTVVENFAYGDTPAQTSVRGLLEELGGLPDHFDVSLYELSHRHDVRTLVVRTLLTYLELEGLLEAGTPTYSSYKFQPLASSAEILSGYQGERKQFLANLFRQANKARTWFNIDLPSAARNLQAPRTRLVAALDYLAERKQIELKVGGVRHRYRWLKRPDDLEELAAGLHAKTLDHERREIERLRLVLELAGRPGCQTAYLCEYFGETLEGDCGHCGWCFSGEAAELLPRPETSIDDEVWRRAEETRAEHAEILTEPRAFARFLTGLSSPRASRARLGGHPLFGALAHVAFGEVLERARG